MKSIYKILFFLHFLLPFYVVAQHSIKMDVSYDEENKTFAIKQRLTFFNQTNDTLNSIVLNDWNNAYSNKNTPLGKRFSDEYIRSFHFSKEKDKGKTSINFIGDTLQNKFSWERITNHPDLIQIRLNKTLFPNQSVVILMDYEVKIPNERFTGYGFDDKGEVCLKNWWITPTRFENQQFIKYSNLNLDDIANSSCNYYIDCKVPKSFSIKTDLNEVALQNENDINLYSFEGENRIDFNLYFTKTKDFISYKNDNLEVVTNLKDNRLNDVFKAIVIDRIVTYVNENVGKYKHKKITISQADYDKNPFYGFNQLPGFLSPFPDEFLFEVKFLKTYLNNYLKTTLQLDNRKDNWLIDAIQIYTMMQYIDEFHPNAKMLGNLNKWKLLRGYRFVSLDFNEQYSYFYTLMARRNLDQPLTISKDYLLKFNEKIASKYRSGLSLKYLNEYLGDSIVPKTIKEFYTTNSSKQGTSKNFEEMIKSKSSLKLDWFFDKIVNSRDIFDYKFKDLTKTKDSISFKLKNKTNTNVPIPIYGLKKKEVVFKNWLEPSEKDTIYKLSRNNADKIVINYKNEVPEFNLRNNSKSLKSFHILNKPIKFNFMKDLEDPFYNKILYVPTLEYNLYDGFLPGMRFHNKTILEKPFIFDVNPTFSTKTQNFTGKGFIYVNQYNRNSNLYNIRYHISGHYLHYAPDAYYKKFSPMVLMRFRPDDFRDNKKSQIIIREIIVNRDKSEFITDENTDNYEIFNARYTSSKAELTKLFNTQYNFELSKSFGKIAGEIQFRKLYENNRQFNLRLFAGTFLFKKTTSTYFDFGLDRPTDYLFESEYIGRSETTGIFSQQSIGTEGFFKSKLETRFANQWMITSNISASIWNWVEVYGDIGMMKNKYSSAKFVYDNGIRLNLVPDYFELYFPVYSNNGWEISQKNYQEKIRFIITFNPETLIGLFTRKWF